MWGLKPSDLNPFNNFFNNPFINFISGILAVLFLAASFSFSIIMLLKSPDVIYILFLWMAIDLCLIFFVKEEIQIENPYLHLLIQFAIIVFYAIGNRICCFYYFNFY